MGRGIDEEEEGTEGEEGEETCWYVKEVKKMLFK